MKIHIIAAMQAEAKYIIKCLNLEKLSDNYEYDVYSKEIDSHSVRLFVNKQRDSFDKIGTVHAALLTYQSIKFERPDFILNIGTCGGIKKHSIELFDLICSHNFVIYHDKFFGDIFKKHSLGSFPCLDLKGKLRDFHHGVVATSNSIIISRKSWEIIDEHNVKCVDMEAAAVAEIAQNFSIPFSALKVVTDLVYVDSHLNTNQDFKNNFHKAMASICSKTSRIFTEIF